MPLRPDDATDPDLTVDEPARDEDGAFEIAGRPLRRGDRIGPYVYERQVGRGGMAHVLLATDPDGREVALKVLRASRFESGLARFRREFHALSRLDHPNVVAVYAYGDLQGHPYIAMEYVDGPDLHQVIRGFRTTDDATRWARCEQVLVDLCRALAAIHRRGLVHRDLKPSNILLTAEGRCKLTDFGIVKDLDPSRSPEMSTTLVGTWAYASPEHIGGMPVDHRSDLYSLGIILFAMLTGKRPFVAESMAGYLEAHRDREAPQASRIRAGVPTHLDEICTRLLQKRPRDRFQSAQEILYRLEADDPHERPRADAVWVPGRVGQEDAVAVVEEAIHGLTAGRGGVVRIFAEDGLGKSRMLDHVVDRARTLGLPFHRHDLRADGPLYDVALKLARDLARELPGEAGDELRSVEEAWADGTTLRGDTRYALYDALRQGLEAVTLEAPRLLILDDLHDARPQEVDLVRFLARSLSAARRPFLVVLASRPHAEAAPEAWHQALEPLDVTLEPLTRADVVALLTDLFGAARPARALADRLHGETDGNPFFLVELIRSLMAQGLLVPDDEAWRMAVDAHELASGHLEIPPGIRQLLRARLDAFDTGDRALLELIAVANHPVDLDTLLMAADLDEEAALDRLDRLIRRGMVREHRHPDDVTYDVIQTQLADLLRRDMPPERRVSLHRALARALAAVHGAEPEILGLVGEHHRHAGDAGKAYEALVTAARRLLDRSMPEAARRVADHALEVEVAARTDLGDQRHDELRGDLLQVQGAAQLHRGGWHAAATTFRDLAEHADDARDPRTAVDARVGLSRALRRLEDHDGALTCAQQALAAARKQHYRKGVAEALHSLSGLAWSQGDMDQCETYADQGLLSCEGPTLAAQRAQLLMSRAAAQATRGQLASAVIGTREAEDLFRQLRMYPLRVLALANLAELKVWQGDVEEARAHADEAVAEAERLGFRLGRAVALRARGIAAIELGRAHAAHDDLLAASHEATDLGVVEEILATHTALVRLELDQHNLLGALDHGSRILAMANERDPERQLPLVQAYLARALAYRDPATAWILLEAVDDAIPTLPTPKQLQVQLAAAWASHAVGATDRAIRLAKALLRHPAARGFRLWILEARMLLAEITSGDEARKHRRIGAELAREYADRLPVTTSEEVRRRPLFRRLEDDAP